MASSGVQFQPYLSGRKPNELGKGAKFLAMAWAAAAIGAELAPCFRGMAGW